MTACAGPGSLEAQSSVRHPRLAMKPCVALQADEADLAPHQQEIVHASVRIVASHAAHHPHRRVLVKKRPALFHMASDAGFPMGLRQHEVIHGSVGIVAIRTFHQTFRHAMVKGKGELRLHRTVTGVAQPGFRFFEQAVMQPPILFGQCRNGEKLPLRGNELHLCGVDNGGNQVHRVALVAGDSGILMCRMGEEILLPAGEVAAQTPLGVFLGVGMEAENQFVGSRFLDRIAMRRLLCIRVSLARPVAGFAGHPHAFNHNLRVGRLAELEKLRPMAGAATIIPHVLVRRSWLRDFRSN